MLKGAAVDGIGEVLYPRVVKKYLESLASALTAAYWRKLRHAFAFYLSEQGYKDQAKQVNKIKNPVTSNKHAKRKPRLKKTYQ